MLFQELKNKMHDQLKIETQEFLENPSDEGNEAIYYLLKNIAMLKTVEPAHVDKTPYIEPKLETHSKPNGLWGAN